MNFAGTDSTGHETLTLAVGIPIVSNCYLRYVFHLYIYCNVLLTSI